ncbi:MAG: Fic family protein [Planctomycetota bacterium]
MQIQDFRATSTGSLVKIASFWGGDHAFEPAPLPPDWDFPLELWPLLAEAKSDLKLLEGVGRGLQNPGVLLGPSRDREAIISSRMEGTYATPRQMLLYELDPREVESEDDPLNQHREVANYARALEHASETALPVGLPLIRQLHQLLLDGVRGDDKEPGRFRSRQVAIGENARFIPPAPEKLHDFLNDLDTYFHVTGQKYDPLVDCFLVHYQFETIHPFADGNGRVGRLLLAVMIQELCGLSQPWVHISESFGQDHNEYCGRMYRVSSEGDWAQWIEYCLRSVVSLAKITIDRCDRLRSLHEDQLDRLPKKRGDARLRPIVDLLFHSPALRITELSKTFAVAYPTAQSDVTKLVDVGILAELPDAYPKTFYAPEIFAIAYEGLD